MRIVLLIAGLVLINIQSFAGKITGKVSDERSGEVLIGASVLIKGTSTGTATDVDGNFDLTAAPGNYTLEVKYVGYQTKEVEGVDVKDDGVTTVNIVIAESKNTQLDEVIVRSSLKKENISALYSIQKNAATISDGISADVIRKSPDRNTGEVLKRVSGTTVQDNKFIVVRGLNERYNVSMLNNSVLPSTEPDKKAFSFDLIPSNLIDNVIIYKTATPDLPGDFSGGAVRISSKDFPERRISEVSLGLSYNSQSTFKDFYMGKHQGRLDWLGYLDNSRSLPSSFPDKTKYLNLPVDQQIAITKTFPDHFGYEKKSSNLPGLNLQLTSGNTYNTKGSGKFGYIFSVGYRTADRIAGGTRDEYDVSKTQLYHYDNKFYTRTATLGSILNFSYTFGKSKISLKNFYNNDFNNRLTLRNGVNFERGEDNPLNIKSYSEEVSQNGLFNSTLEGSHALGKHDQHKLDWNLSYGNAYKIAPDQKILSFVQDTTIDPAYYIKLSNVNSPAIKDAGRVYSRLKESIYNGGVDYTNAYKISGNAQKLKIGLAGSYRYRTVDVTALGYSSTLFSGQVIRESDEINANTIFSSGQLEQYSPSIILANILSNSIDYTGQSISGAGYISSENKFGAHFRVVWGARIEHFVQILTLGKTDNTKTNTDVLPSVNLTYALTEKANLRLSGFQAVNRPEFREFAPYRYYDYDNDFIIAGNPDIKRSKSTNIDLRYEFFPAAGEIISGSAFYKNFKDPIEQLNLGNSVLTYDNTKQAIVYGVELEIRKSLSFISVADFFSNLSFYLNTAYIKGSVDLPNKPGTSSLLQGQSPYILNTGLSYATKSEGVSFNLLYNRIGERIKFRGQGNFDIWEKSRDVLDFQIGKRIMKNKGELKLTLSDLLAQSQVYYYKYADGTNYKEGEDKKISTADMGRTISISFKYNF